MSVVNNAQAPTRANNGLPILRLVPWFFLLWWVVLASMIARQTYFLPIAHHQALNTTTLSTEPIIPRGPKILYIVTSMAEFDNGQRNTLQGRDRYQESLVPVVSEAVASMLSFGYEVDLYLITHYEVRSERRELLREKLPTRVGFEVWDDATPLGYKFQPGNNNKKNGQEDGQQELIQPITNALSRQHRLVIKDKLLHYDLFVSFEDDMLINGHHVQHYFAMTDELRQMKYVAPLWRPTSTEPHPIKPLDQYYGNLTKIQLARLLPGFIRVEVVANKRDFQRGRQEIPVSVLRNTSKRSTVSIDAKPCCFRSRSSLADNLQSAHHRSLARPGIDDIFLWETQSIALGLHKMPDSSSLDWVVLQRGVDQVYLPREKMIGEYWTGTNLSNNVAERPNPTHPKFINNMGGWMATPEQILAWHRSHCKGQLLPPYDDRDGLKNNVEYWSGGLSLVGMNTCQLQRIISLKPEDFSKHLIYHTSNNKQKSKNLAFTNVQDFWDELYSVQLEAEVLIPST